MKRFLFALAIITFWGCNTSEKKYVRVKAIVDSTKYYHWGGGNYKVTGYYTFTHNNNLHHGEYKYGFELRYTATYESEDSVWVYLDSNDLKVVNMKKFYNKEL